MKLLLAAASVLAAITSSNLSAALICPSTINTNSDCGYIITIGPGGTITGAPVAGANPYDGGDDALVGVVNNSGSTFTGPIALTGSGNGGGIFGFDGDGICTFASTNSVSLSYCSAAQKSGVDPVDYEGPINTFTGINASGTSGTVVITGLAAGTTTFFSLEGSPASINVAVGGAPEPGTILLLGCGLGALGLLKARSK